MQPPVLTEMAISHVLVFTALEEEMKAPQCPLIREMSESEDSWILVPETGLALLDMVFQYRWCKERNIDHVLVGGRWRRVQNCSVFRGCRANSFSKLSSTHTGGNKEGS